MAASPKPLDTMPYGAELEAAMAAVRLASSLCEVRKDERGDEVEGMENQPALSHILPPQHSQRVQAKLREGEATEKDDASPVTVADYGEETEERRRGGARLRVSTSPSITHPSSLPHPLF